MLQRGDLARVRGCGPWRALVYAFLVAAFMFLVCFAYLTALNFKINTLPVCEPEIQDEGRKPSVWDDPEWWKNPWVL